MNQPGFTKLNFGWQPGTSPTSPHASNDCHHFGQHTWKERERKMGRAANAAPRGDSRKEARALEPHPLQGGRGEARSRLQGPPPLRQLMSMQLFPGRGAGPRRCVFRTRSGLCSAEQRTGINAVLTKGEGGKAFP